MDYKDVISLVSKVLNPSEYIEVMTFLNSQQDRISYLTDKTTQQQEIIMRLQSQIADYERWDEEKQKYEIVQGSEGTTFYRLKDTTQTFCPMCFNKHKVPIHLQPSIERAHKMRNYKFCPNCKNTFDT